VFTARLRARLTDLPGQFVEAKGADLFWLGEQRLPPPEAIDAFLKDGARIRDLLLNG